MARMNRMLGLGLLVGLAVLAQSCGDDDGAGPNGVTLEFTLTDIDLQAGRDTVMQVRNTGTVATGPVEFVPLAVRDTAGTMVSGPSLAVVPTQLLSLNPGATASVALSITTPPGTPNGDYRVNLEARTPASGLLATTLLRFSVTSGTGSPTNTDVMITGGPTAFVRGDVVQFIAEVTDSAGAVIPGATVQWSVLGFGLFDVDGQFVAYSTGQISVVARSGSSADTLAVTVSDRTLTGSFTVVGPGGGATASAGRTSDLWVNGNVLYSGTHSGGNGAFHAWSIATPTNPVLMDSIFIDASIVNDVKIRDDGTLAVITHEGSSDGLNGVTLLDMTDPNHPTVITRYTQGLEAGVHNAWIDGNDLYLVTDGASPSTGGLRILNITNPSSPTQIGSFYGGSSSLHDVYVRGGLAFLSHWRAGVIILDVGDGRAGGSPSNPVEIGRLLIPNIPIHNIWYWPSSGYAFIGDEITSPGTMYVVDVSDMTVPRQVATFALAGATPHNFWLDETRGILYAAWYGRGIRAIDVNGQLMGELERQGREIAGFEYDGGSTNAWAPQLHNGLIYLTDFGSGVWVLQPNF